MIKPLQPSWRGASSLGSPGVKAPECCPGAGQKWKVSSPSRCCSAHCHRVSLLKMILHSLLLPVEEAILRLLLLMVPHGVAVEQVTCTDFRPTGVQAERFLFTNQDLGQNTRLGDRGCPEVQDASPCFPSPRSKQISNPNCWAHGRLACCLWAVWR